jgi:hypothetical protein
MLDKISESYPSDWVKMMQQIGERALSADLSIAAGGA